MSDRPFLSVFTPSRTPPEVLEAILVQRHALLDDAVERVHESATSGNKHHLLFVGPRGTGKTHLVTVLVQRLAQHPDLLERLRIAWLNEDETSTSLLELFQRIHAALVKRYPDEVASEALEPMFDMRPDDAELWLGRLLLERLHRRTLLVVVENLDALFEGLGISGQQKLRAFIQEHPVMTLVATAQRLVVGVKNRNSAFFGFFQVEHLHPLSVEQAADLLRKIAALNGQRQVAAFLAGAQGRSRVRALHHLAGGNHRIYIVLSQFITRDSIDALVEPFSKMVDEMTPYYQERIRWLPTQQRKIVEWLCTCERPTPVKQLARRLFATPQTISSQLKDLREKGYVQSAQRGRASLYEIAEPMMRICVEVKENQAHESLRVLVDFLRVWYEGRELSARLMVCGSESQARGYLETAIEANEVQGNLRARLLVEGFRAELGGDRALEWEGRIVSYAKESEELALACGEWAKGNADEALAIIEEITDKTSGQSVPVRASGWMLAAEIHFRKGALESAVRDLGSILNLPGVPVEQIARALVNRGVAHWRLGDAERTEQDFVAVLQLEGAPTEDRVDAQLNFVELRIGDGRWDSAMMSLADALEEGSRGDARYTGGSKHIIDAFFESSLTTKLRRARARELTRIYRDNAALAQLGEALTEHLGSLHAAIKDLPTADNLESWAWTWEQAGNAIDALRLPLRIFRAGIDFLKTGGKDRGILLGLNQEERRVLEQALRLDSGNGS